MTRSKKILRLRMITRMMVRSRCKKARAGSRNPAGKLAKEASLSQFNSLWPEADPKETVQKCR
jgi:hypothetical protein